MNGLTSKLQKSQITLVLVFLLCTCRDDVPILHSGAHRSRETEHNYRNSMLFIFQDFIFVSLLSVSHVHCTLCVYFYLNKCNVYFLCFWLFCLLFIFHCHCGGVAQREDCPCWWECSFLNELVEAQSQVLSPLGAGI